MTKRILSPLLSGSLMAAIAALFGANVSATTASPAAAPSFCPYSWEYIANEVYHCSTDGTEFCCQPESAHSWEE